MRKIVENYKLLFNEEHFKSLPLGDSVSPKEIIFHIMRDNSELIKVLDIGFGTGGLGRLIKNNHSTNHWEIDGVDGWHANCFNKELIDRKIYKNIYHGLAQELSNDLISKYRIICLLDVIEHLDSETAKWLLRTLLANMGENSYLFISTPLWFYPQNQQEHDDLEEHLIGIPITSMMALLPIMYSINNPLVGGFVYSKRSLDYIEFFQPTSNKNFSYQMGLNIASILNLPVKPGTLYKTAL
jgi:2-polyprenyl-3-methyl-5-hydroxy-6-metoxy-1,4-benzoquinol methylase